MTASAQTDVESTHARPERAAVTALLVSMLFLGIGAVLWLLALLTLRFPSFLSSPFNYGRLFPMAMVSLTIGWLVPALSSAVFYLLPRLTGAPLGRSRLAALMGPGSAAVAIAGIIVVGAGLGDGLAPLSLPWWLDLPALAVLTIPLAVTLETIRGRQEEGVYVSLWFLASAVVWLPLLYLFTNVPGLSSVAKEIQAVSFPAGFAVLWVAPVGIGAAYYTVAKDSGNPLANRQLVRIGFWSLAFAGAWAGPIRLAFGPGPEWLGPVSIVLTLALPVAMVANAAAIAQTIGSKWEEIGEHPALLATAAGMGLAVVGGILTALGGFRSASAAVSLTSFWDGIDVLWIFGMGGLLLAGYAYQAIPAMTGRQPSETGSRRHTRLTVWGVGAATALLVAAGLVTGYNWTGGSFVLGSFAKVADNWTAASGPSQVLLGLGVLAGVVVALGALVLVLNVYRALTSGRVTAQEVLVEGGTR